MPTYLAASAPVGALFALMTKLGVYAILRTSTLAFSAGAGPSAGFGETILLYAGLATGAGFLAVLVALGALREVLGHGTLFAGMPMLAGPGSGALELDLHFDGMLAAILPPGAFLGMAALLALRNWLTRERGAADTTAANRPPLADGP